MLKAISSVPILLLLVVVGLTGVSVYVATRKHAPESVITTTTSTTSIKPMIAPVTTTSIIITTILQNTIQTTIPTQPISYTTIQTTTIILTTTIPSTVMSENCCSNLPGSLNGYNLNCHKDVLLNPGINQVCWGSEIDDYGNNRDYYSGWFKCPEGYFVGRIWVTADLADLNDCIYSYNEKNEERSRICGNSDTVWSSYTNTSWVKFRFKSDSSGVADGVLIDSIECVYFNISLTSTSTTTSTSTSTSTFTSIPTNTSTSTTTSTTTELIGKCDICPPPNECTISCGQTILDLNPEHGNFFKFTLNEPDFVNISLTPQSSVDYDIYIKWTTEFCPYIDGEGVGWDCRPYPDKGIQEYCEQNLDIGTYYIMVDRYSGDGSYNISLNCAAVSTTFPTSNITTPTCLNYGESCESDADCCSGLICQVFDNYRKCVYQEFTSTTSTTTTTTTSTTTTFPSCPYTCQCRQSCTRFGCTLCKCLSGYEKVEGYSCPYDPSSDWYEACCKKITPDVSMEYPLKPYYQGDILDLNITATDDKGISIIEIEIVNVYNMIENTWYEYYDCHNATPCSHIFNINLTQTGWWQFEARVNDTDNHWTTTFPNGNSLLQTVNVNSLTSPTTTSSTTTTSTSSSTSTTTSTTQNSTTSEPSEEIPCVPGRYCPTGIIETFRGLFKKLLETISKIFNIKF